MSDARPFADETRVDAWLLEHSKFLRNHIKHKKDYNGDANSKHEKFWDHNAEPVREQNAQRSTEPLEAYPTGAQRSQLEQRSAGYSGRDESVMSSPREYGRDGVMNASELSTSPATPAYEQERSPFVSAQNQGKAVAPGLIEMHPTHMESPMVEKPRLHSLVSESRVVNSGHIGYSDAATGRSP